MPEPPGCHSCGARGLETFFEVTGVPVHSVLLMDSREEARGYPKGELSLAFCRSCGFIQNQAFDPGLHEYSTRYEETQAFSPRFNRFAEELAERLIQRHGLHDKDLLEIGCGKGEFLVLLCEKGPNRGIGLDPGYVEERTSSEAASRLRFIQDFYDERYAHLEADFVCCRHTLEHIQPVQEFMGIVRRSIGDRHDTVVFFELPDIGRVLEEQAFWDLYYEHCSYFSPGSLARLFRRTGFEVLDLDKGFDDQYLLLEARPVRHGRAGDVFPVEDDPLELRAKVEGFRKGVSAMVQDWKLRLREMKAAGRRCVIWGSGSKAVSYLTTMGIEDEIEYVVDINLHRHGKFMPGTGHAIVAPEFLKTYEPDTVVVMNPIYTEEIRAMLKGMGLELELLVV